MTPGGPAPRGEQAARPPKAPSRAVARQELRERIVHLCEAVLWRMARRRMR